MSHSNPSPSGQTIFSPGEVATFRAEDRSAATAIVGLMVSIFSMGLIGYLIVAYWVS